MALDLHDCQFHGPALPAPFVTFELEKELTKRKLLVKTTGERVGLLSNGVQLLLLLGDPARLDSTVTKASEMLQPDASLVGEGKEVAPAGQQHFVPIELRQNILYTVSNAPRHSQGSKPLGQAAAVNQPLVGPDDGGPRNPLEGTDKLTPDRSSGWGEQLTGENTLSSRLWGSYLPSWPRQGERA